MSSSSGSFEANADLRREVARLADIACEGALGPKETAALNELLENNLYLCQWFQNYVGLHSHLLVYRGYQSASDLEHMYEARAEKSRAKELSRKRFVAASIFAVVTVLMLAVGSTLFINTPLPIVGSITVISDDAEWNGEEYLPGDLLRKRDPLVLSKGSVSIQTNEGVIITALDDTSMRWFGEKELSLQNGRVLVHVVESGHGFQVRTRDCIVTDLGTRFMVDRNIDSGTTVVVDEGRVSAELISAEGATSHKMELLAGQAATFLQATDEAKSIPLLSEWKTAFDQLDRPDRGILRTSGAIRAPLRTPVVLTDGVHQTNGFASIFKERMGTALPHDLTVVSAAGNEVQLDAGTLVDSYLLHFNPPADVSQSGPGSITFRQPILGLILDGQGLVNSDSVLGISKTKYELNADRGFETPEDEWSISSDKFSITFHPGITADKLLDQCRVLLLHPENKAVTSR
ncbi:FecR domain-containing protein [Calycomorphotria hydatis]|uniref:FecR protein n=1 Tax=Calycomorphotria hydatis TaxID=2528027 RepID=A0A517T9V5_9PLAN|nr:FecR family protein [Calycomorphotria hydatis]QDT65160.1 FecR protein [Calycomorphotria hydatis]